MIRLPLYSRNGEMAKLQSVKNVSVSDDPANDGSNSASIAEKHGRVIAKELDEAGRPA